MLGPELGSFDFEGDPLGTNDCSFVGEADAGQYSQYFPCVGTSGGLHCVELSEQHEEAQFPLLSPLHIIPGGIHPLGTKLGPELGSVTTRGNC